MIYNTKYSAELVDISTAEITKKVFSFVEDEKLGKRSSVKEEKETLKVSIKEDAVLEYNFLDTLSQLKDRFKKGDRFNIPISKEGKIDTRFVSVKKK